MSLVLPRWFTCRKRPTSLAPSWTVRVQEPLIGSVYKDRPLASIVYEVQVIDLCDMKLVMCCE